MHIQGQNCNPRDATTQQPERIFSPCLGVGGRTNCTEHDAAFRCVHRDSLTDLYGEYDINQSQITQELKGFPLTFIEHALTHKMSCDPKKSSPLQDGCKTQSLESKRGSDGAAQGPQRSYAIIDIRFSQGSDWLP
jgi:hypothetical protein